MEAWMQKNGLGEYAKGSIDAGYDDPTIISLFDKDTVKAWAKRVCMKPGHEAKLFALCGSALAPQAAPSTPQVVLDLQAVLDAPSTPQDVKNLLLAVLQRRAETEVKAMEEALMCRYNGPQYSWITSTIILARQVPTANVGSLVFRALLVPQSGTKVATALLKGKWNIASAVIVCGIECAYHVIQYFQGEITGKTAFKCIVATAAGGATGFVGAGVGAGVGAAMGSCVPVVGTVIGAIVGAILGGVFFGLGGQAVAQAGMELLLPENDEEKISPKKRKQMFAQACKELSIDPDDEPERQNSQAAEILKARRADIFPEDPAEKQRMELDFLTTYKCYMIIKCHNKSKVGPVKNDSHGDDLD